MGAILAIINKIFGCVFFLFGFISSNNLFPPPLSKSDEEYQLRRLFEGNAEAKNILIEHNLRLVAHIAKKYTKDGQDNEELISIGTVGLIKGINSFQNNRGFKLSTYCSRCIENEILMYLRNGKKYSNDISLNSVIGTDKDGNDMELSDIVASQDNDMVEDIYIQTMSEKIKSYIDNNLPEREKKVIYMRYGLGNEDEKTQQEVADILGISRSYVSRIETKIQKKIKTILDDGKQTV